MDCKERTGKTLYVKRTMKDRQSICLVVSQTDHFWNWKWTRTQLTSLRFSNSTETDCSSRATSPPSTSPTLRAANLPADSTKPRGSSLNNLANISTKVTAVTSKCKFSPLKPRVPSKLQESPKDPTWPSFTDSKPSRNRQITSSLFSIWAKSLPFWTETCTKLWKLPVSWPQNPTLNGHTTPEVLPFLSATKSFIGSSPNLFSKSNLPNSPIFKA